MTDWNNIRRDISTCCKVIEGTLAEFEETMHKCSSPFCDELTAKHIFIPLKPCNKLEFSAISYANITMIGLRNGMKTNGMKLMTIQRV